MSEIPKAFKKDIGYPQAKEQYSWSCKMKKKKREFKFSYKEILEQEGKFKQWGENSIEGYRQPII